MQMGLGGDADRAGAGGGAIGIDLGIDGFSTATLIGQGGFGAVYRARQDALERWVAIKVLTMAAIDDESLARFDRECRAFGTLSDHPYIVGVHGCGMNAWGRPYIVMDHVEDGSLADRVARRGPLRWTNAVEMFVKIASAVDAAHSAGILHRDIKPQNILLSRYGDPLLSDFGISSIAGHHSSSGALTASLEHAAPELLDGVLPSESSDVYSLASTLFAALSGAPPFGYDSAGSLPGLISLITSSTPPDLRPRGVPGSIAAVVEQGLAKDPSQRFPSAGAFAAALQRVQEAQGVPATTVPVSSGERDRELDAIESYMPPAPITAPTRERIRKPARHSLHEPKRRRPTVALLLSIPIAAAAITAIALWRPHTPHDATHTVAVVESTPTPTPTPRAARSRSKESRSEPRKGENHHRRHRVVHRAPGPTLIVQQPVASVAGGSYAPPASSEKRTGSRTKKENPRHRDKRRDQPKGPGAAPPLPPRPSVPMYHLYKDGTHIMTIDPYIADIKNRQGYTTVLEGYVYDSAKEGTRAIQITNATVYVMPSPDYETEPAATHVELYRLTKDGKTIYTDRADERDLWIGRGWSGASDPVGWVQSG